MSVDTYVIVGEVTIRYIRYIQKKFKFLLKTYLYDLIYSRQLNWVNKSFLTVLVCLYQSDKTKFSLFLTFLYVPNHRAFYIRWTPIVTWGHLSLPNNRNFNITVSVSSAAFQYFNIARHSTINENFTILNTLHYYWTRHWILYHLSSITSIHTWPNINYYKRTRWNSYTILNYND